MTIYFVQIYQILFPKFEIQPNIAKNIILHFYLVKEDETCSDDSRSTAKFSPSPYCSEYKYNSNTTEEYLNIQKNQHQKHMMIGTMTGAVVNEDCKCIFIKKKL